MRALIRASWAVPLVGVAALLAGCGSDPGKTNDKATPAAEVTLTDLPATKAKFAEVVAAHKGKIVVVDIWGEF